MIDLEHEALLYYNKVLFPYIDRPSFSAPSRQVESNRLLLLSHDTNHVTRNMLFVVMCTK